MRKQRFGWGFALMAAILAGGATVSHGATIPTNQTASKKDAINQRHVPVRPVSQRNIIGSGDANPRKHLRKGFLNQEEKRKKLRSNHHFTRSRKCTTKR